MASLEIIRLSRTAWHRKHPGTTEMVAPVRKLHALMQNELYRYRLEVFGTERARGREWTRDTRIRALRGTCAVCGNLFVGQRTAKTCSGSCGSRLRTVPLGSNDDLVVEHLQQQGQPQVTTAGKYPELVAVEAIADALRTIDNAAWERVVDYAKHLAGNTSETATLRIVEQHEAAAD